jgi:hypothetical protein
MKKNLLKENMRRFKTKNLNEDNFNLTDLENKLGFDSGANRDPKTGNLINTTNNLMIVFSGDEKFMDRVAVNVLKKYGFDKTQINRSYDANEGIVEFTVNMPSDIAEKIGDALEKADGVTNQYGGYYELEK